MPQLEANHHLSETNAPSGPITITRAGLIGTIGILIIAIVCVRLGIWQLHRLAQRQERNRLLASRMAGPPLHVTSATRDTTNLIYRRAIVEGRYDHDRAIVLSGRSLRGMPGVYLLTPALFPGGRTAVLVNRGWVPAADAATVYLDSLRTPDEAQLTGLVLPFPHSGRPSARSDASARDTGFQHLWFNPNEEELRAQFPYTLLPFEVQALPEPGADNRRVPVRVPAPERDNGPHLGYAIQWFSFALIFLVGWVTLMLRRGEIRRVQRAEP
jgi:surfeit locus 1 family protein